MSDPDSFLREAIRLSGLGMASDAGGPFGALIVRDGAIIAQASNEVTSANDPTAHAEIVAIRRACDRLQTFTLTGCVLYTSCEPCPMCLGAIYWARLDAVYFAATRDDAAQAGFDDAFLYRELTLPLDQRHLPTTAVEECRADAQAIFRAWLEKPDRKSY